jgi:predicted Ser/Thr protein kinase
VLSDRYRLVYTLGGGGMGSVWLAEDTLLERSVALKELIQHAGPANLAERRKRALQEARALARVRHPAIVPIHDVFFIDEDPWIVMEYISGRSLHDIIKDQALDETLIARIGLHVLRGLIAVHRAGVVHRDVKPTNILVANDDSIFLVDFGIARIAGDASLTGQAIVGTPDFLAPERFRPGYEVGPAADIWALGVTFYFALEGYSPFWRDSERGWEATMIAILKDEPRPPSRGGQLADVTLRMLHKDPDRRADAHQVLAVLERIVGAESAELSPAPASPNRASASALPDQIARLDEIGKADDTYLQEPPAPQRGRSVAKPARRNGDGRDGYRPGGGGRGPRLEDAHEMIRNVGIDTGVAMLLAMSEGDAARVLADCPPRLCGALLQGIAAERPTMAATILGLLRPVTAGHAFAYLRLETAASLIVAMVQSEAQRILESTDERTAAGVIMELPAPTSTVLLRSMNSRQHAARVLTHVRPATAAELLSSDPEFAGAVLRHLSEPVRKQVSRYLLAERTRPR